MKFFAQAEGYVNVTVGKYNTLLYNYAFNYTDHLGNIRLTYGLDPSTNVLKVMEENHYYPFGLKHTNYNSQFNIFVRKAEEEQVRMVYVPPVESFYKFKFNGKSWEDELGLNFYDYGARNYDPAIGRWMNIDPLAEMSRKWSPYTYCYNNPLVFVDPDGMFANPGDFINENGKKIGNDGKNDGKVYVIKTTKTTKEMDSGVNSAGITKEQAKLTEKFIKENSGNSSAFESNSNAYDNSVEIEGSPQNSQQAQLN